MKTKRKILEETANFYNSSNRGSEITTCVYLTQDGKMCAVGRCLKNPQIFMDDDVGGLMDVVEGYLESHLKEEYRGHSMVFWKQLQNFHDISMNWDENGMSVIGKTAYTIIRKHYC